MATTLNTRIVLRNDSTSNWLLNENQVLLKGEVGIEFLDNEKVKIKIGDGVKTWSELSYFGGEEGHVFQTILNAGETHDTAIKRIVNDSVITTGDIAIIKELITDSKYTYTAYVYDGEKWCAMDGNYSSDNVYFTDDMTVTTKVGTITELTNGSATFSTAGKSLTQVLNSLLAEEKDPIVDTPSVTYTTGNQSGEVGSSYTLPTATLKVTDVGSYTYGSKDENGVQYGASDTGVTFAVGDITLSQGDNTKTNTTVMTTNNTLAITATTTGDKLFSDSSISYTFCATAAYTASDRIPVTNLGNKVNELQIQSGTLTIPNCTATMTGWRKMFMGAVTDSSAEITSDVIRGLTLVNKQVSKSAQTFTVPVGATKIIIAFPATYSSSTPKFEYFTMSWEEFAGFTEADSVQVADARGGENGLKEYTVYTFAHANPSGFESDTQFRVTLR